MVEKNKSLNKREKQQEEKRMALNKRGEESKKQMKSGTGKEKDGGQCQPTLCVITGIFKNGCRRLQI